MCHSSDEDMTKETLKSISNAIELTAEMGG